MSLCLTIVLLKDGQQGLQGCWTRRLVIRACARQVVRCGEHRRHKQTPRSVRDDKSRVRHCRILFTTHSTSVKITLSTIDVISGK